MSAASTPAARGLLGWLWRGYLRRHLGLLLLAVVFMSIEGGMLGVLSWMMRPMFDRVFVGGDGGAIWWVGLVFLLAFVVRGLASVAQKGLMARLSQLSVAQMRSDLVRHMMRLDSGFHQRFGPGYLMQRVEGDVGQILNVWNAVLTGAGRDVISVIVLLGVAISVDWRWTLIAGLGIPLLVLPTALLQRSVRRNARTARDVAARLSVRLNEIFHGIQPIKLNRLEEYQARRYEDLTKGRIGAEVRSAVGQAALPGLIDVTSGFGFMAVLFWGGAEIISGTKTLGDFMTFFAAIGLAFEPVRRLGAVAGIWQAAAASVERLREILDTRPALKDPDSPVPVPSGDLAIRFQDVRFSHGEAEVLRGLTFTADAGKTTAIVGASGAGKSTVFNVLTRIYDASEGLVEVGGVPVTALRLADLRGLFSVVSQEALLFDDSLRENILLGREADPDAVQAALDAAHVSEFAERLPQGLDTPAGPRGSGLSGGQRQRVAIARAILRDAPILLLDEATSALDAQSEALVQAALDRAARGRTTLVVAHRLSTVRGADKIVVLDRGRVAEEGTHDALMARGGLYADLHRLQGEGAA